MENEAQQHGIQEGLEQGDNSVNDSQTGDITIKETLLNITKYISSTA